MNVILDRQKLITEISNWLNTENKGFFITLNSTTKDKIQFEQSLSKMAHKLNDLCYGRAYERKEKRLKIMACIEVGGLNDMLHAHLVITHNDDMIRTLQEVNTYVRKHWYALIEQNNVNGNMVDVKKLKNIENFVEYITKDTKYFSRQNNFNLLTL